MNVAQVETAAREAICGRCMKRVQASAVVGSSRVGMTADVVFECHGKRAIVTVSLTGDGPGEEFWFPFGRSPRAPAPPVVFRHGTVSPEARRERRATGRR